MELLEEAIINWLYALENRDEYLLQNANKWLCHILSESDLAILFSVLRQLFDYEEEAWLKEVLSV